MNSVAKHLDFARKCYTCTVLQSFIWEIERRKETKRERKGDRQNTN